MSIEKPLYRLLRELSDYISNRNECASIVGYTLAQSILHFSTTSGDPQEIKFEQVKDLYRRIQENIDDCRRSGSEDSCKNPGFNILSSLEARLSPELKYEVLQSYFTAEAEPEGKKRENRTPLRPALVQ